MSAINDLVQQIENAELRDRILNELNKLGKQKKSCTVQRELIDWLGLSES